MTDAELQAALSNSPTPPAGVTASTTDTFDVFVTDTSAPAPTVEVPATAPAVAMSATTTAADQNSVLMQQMMQQNQQLIAQMQEQMQAARAPAPAAPAAPPQFSLDSVLDANDREIFKDFLPLLEKVTSAQRQHMDTNYLSPLQARVAELSKATQEAQQRAAGASDSSFTAALYSRVPELPKVVNTPEWRAYLKSTAPFSGGQTVEQRVVSAYQAGDVNTISEFYSEFATRRAGPGAPAVVPAAGAPARAATVAPVAAGAPGAVSPRFVSQARLDAALHAAQSGKMSRDTYEKLMDDMLSAGLEGAQLVN